MEFTIKTSVLLNIAKKMAVIPDSEQLMRISRDGDSLLLETYSRKVSSFMEVTIADHDLSSLNGDDIAVFPLKRFKVALELCPADGTVSINCVSDKTVIDNGRSRTTIKNVDNSTFVKSEKIEGECVLKSPAAAFSKILAESSSYTESNSTAYALSCVHIAKQDDNYVAVATDGRAMSVIPFETELVRGELNNNVLIPAYFCSMLARICYDVLEYAEIAITYNAIAVRWEGFHVQSTLNEGRYPNWRKIIPDTSDAIKIDFDRLAISGVVNSVLKLSDDKFKKVDLVLKDNAVDFSTSTETTSFFETIETDTKASGTICFDAKYLKWLSTCPSDSDRVAFQFVGSAKPALLSIDDMQLVVMPISK